MKNTYVYGIRVNITQFVHQLIQVFFVGLTIGMMRTVIPALAESEFGVPKGSFLMLMAFVIAFGFVKGILNFAAGRLSEFYGRKKVLLAGWIFAVPIPFLIVYARSWDWIVGATVLLGINQGLTWSMTQTSKLDLTRADQRGLTIGLNEFSGYVGVAVAGIATGYLADFFGARMGIFYFGSSVILISIILVLVWVKETRHWAEAEAASHKLQSSQGPLPRYPKNISENPSTWEVFTLITYRDKRFFAFSQSGLVEKFVDALIWVFYPLYFFEKGISLSGIGWIVGIYGFVWGGFQFFTGRLSDRIGRRIPIVAGMWICGGGVFLTLTGESVAWWSISSAVTGLGMALLYPNISAAVADISHPIWRGTAIGIYRFWRDLGYGIGAVLLGFAANAGGNVSYGFYFTAGAMFVSGLIVWILGEETHPRLNPAPTE